MNSKKIHNRKALKESETVEFKKSTSLLKEALVSISAILNKHQKGELYFGLKNDGIHVKNDISEKTTREISQNISNKIEPKIFPHIEIIKTNNIEVIKVTFAGQQIPYSADGRYYIRVGDENKQLSAQELSVMLLKNRDLRWDTLANSEAALKDIDLEKVKKFCALAEIKYTSLKDILESTNLIKEDHLLNASLLLFAKQPVKFFRNSKLQCSVFASTTTSVIIDQKLFEDDIFTLIEEAQNYILKNINIGMELDGLYRKDIPEINKEAVINAFIHRDYFDPDFISVYVFKDRVEIRNPGELFGGLTIKDIQTRHISKRRNELIADALSRAHYVERKGRGIALIKEKEPDTEFSVLGSVFITMLKRTNYKIPKELVEKLAEGLAENQKKIMLLVFEDPKISKRKLANKLGISTTAVDKNIEKLKKLNILQRVGPAKGGEWKIIFRDK